MSQKKLGKGVIREPAATYAAFEVEDWRTTSPSLGDLGAELGLAEQVTRGIPTDAVDQAIDEGVVPARVIFDVVIPRRTLTHRKDMKQRLSTEESDRFTRVLRIFRRAVETLGDAERAGRWLEQQNGALQGKRPVDLLSSDAGARAIEKVLGRIEHGVFS